MPLISAAASSPPAGSATARRFRWSRRAWIGAVAAVLVFWATAALAWWAVGGVVPWDSKNHFYPMLRYLAASLAQGEWPLWNPYHFSGHPTVADPQSLLFTPTMVLFAWLELGAFDGAVRRCRLRAPADAGLRRPRAVLPPGLASDRRSHRRDDDRSWRLGRRPPAAHGHDLQLFVLPARAALP